MPSFVNQVTVGDLIQASAVLIASLGLFLNLLQMKAGNRQKRAEYIITLYNQSALDKDIEEIYYKIEYGKFQYDGEFHQSAEEKQLDKLLELYENIAKLYKLNNFTLDDLDYVAYNYVVIYQDEAVRRYLDFLDEWYEQRGMKVKPFSAFREVGSILEKKYFKKEGHSV